MPDLAATLAHHLTLPGTGWSMGTFGATADFRHDPGEAAEAAPFLRVTARGGIRIESLAGVIPVAWEIPLARPGRWGHGVALCLPEDAVQGARRTALTELGPDTAALRPADRGAVLFDLGLGAPQVDFCIRTRDPALLAVLRAGAGRALFEPENPALAVILKLHPHRVALGALGRVEVFQKIGGPATGGVSPPGPQTHVLPQLLRSGRTHSAHVILPEGVVPCAFLYPENPLAGPQGEARAFVRAAHDAFQDLVAAWALPGHREVKEALAERLAERVGPGSLSPIGREGRRALRVALRQARQVRGEDALLRSWIAHHDPQRRGEGEASVDLMGYRHG